MSAFAAVFLRVHKREPASNILSERVLFYQLSEIHLVLISDCVVVIEKLFHLFPGRICVTLLWGICFSIRALFGNSAGGVRLIRIRGIRGLDVFAGGVRIWIIRALLRSVSRIVIVFQSLG